MKNKYFLSMLILLATAFPNVALSSSCQPSDLSVNLTSSQNITIKLLHKRTDHITKTKRTLTFYSFQEKNFIITTEFDENDIKMAVLYLKKDGSLANAWINTQSKSIIRKDTSCESGYVIPLKQVNFKGTSSLSVSGLIPVYLTRK